MRLSTSLENYLKRIVISVGGRGFTQSQTNVSWKHRGLECAKEMNGDTTDKLPS